MRPTPVTGALQRLRCRHSRGAGLDRACLCVKLPPNTDPPLSASIGRRLAIRRRAPANLMSRISCIMRHWPAASAATTVLGGTATPSVRPQGAPRARSRPGPRLSAARSANAHRSPVLRPSPTGIEGRRCKLQAPLSFGCRAAARALPSLPGSRRAPVERGRTASGFVPSAAAASAAAARTASL
jgi:hypothetical protein